jgi:hypothetical protein
MSLESGQTKNAPLPKWRLRLGSLLMLVGLVLFANGAVDLFNLFVDRYPMLWYLAFGFLLRFAGNRLQGEERWW